MPTDAGAGGTPAENANGAQGAAQTTQPTPPKAENIEFGQWIKNQPAEVQAAFDKHTTGLKNTVQATREERDSLSGQLKELVKVLGNGTAADAVKLANEMAANLETANRRTAFVEEAVRPEIGCRNPKAAYALAVSEDMFDKKGNVDWKALKEAAPELFGAAGGGQIRSNAGAGTSSQPKPQNTMNDFIRSRAGRGGE